MANTIHENTNVIRIFNNMGMVVKPQVSIGNQRKSGNARCLNLKRALYSSVAYQQGYFAGLIGEIERLEDSIGDM